MKVNFYINLRLMIDNYTTDVLNNDIIMIYDHIYACEREIER